LFPPSGFIALAESSGLIGELGDWVLGEACRQNREWQTLGLPPIRVAVNVSALQLGSGFAETVRKSLERARLSPVHLELELTESLAFGEPNVLAMLGELTRLGIGLAIDDFGTGYSCLSHLKCCPVTAIKIDRQFVERLADDGHNRAIVQAIIGLAHALDMRVIAEGPEHVADVIALRQFDCDEAQGFWFAQPMPAAALARFLGQRRRFAMDNADTPLVSCCVCCKEIPLSAALTPEGAEYIGHFCGTECLQRFSTRAEHEAALATPSLERGKADLT
jgi:EAL domain-containing protein (putative c-di-GMP-specific phosphodiesterase class I)